jgi:hypothetical protein
MSNSELHEFLRRKGSQHGPEPIDWNAKKVSWEIALNALYAQLESFLGNLISENVLKISRRPVIVQEDYLGSYQVDQLVLSVGGEQVLFAPKGVAVAGASGRVDVLGQAFTRTLLWVKGDGSSPSDWSFIVSRSPKLKLVEFSQDSLLDVLKDTMTR